MGHPKVSYSRYKSLQLCNGSFCQALYIPSCRLFLPTFADERRVSCGLVVLVAQDEEGALALHLPAHRRAHLHLHRLPLPLLLFYLVTGHRLLLLLVTVVTSSAPGWGQVQWQVVGADPEGVRVLKREREEKKSDLTSAQHCDGIKIYNSTRITV